MSAAQMWPACASLLWGCGAGLGEGERDKVGRGDLFGEVDCSEEIEPNDLEDDGEYDWIGLVSEDRSPSMCGELSETGVRGDGTYNGDYDYLAFQTLGALTVELDLDIEEDTPIDMLLLDQDGEWIFIEEGDSVRVPDGFHFLVLVAAEGSPSDYALTIED